MRTELIHFNENNTYKILFEKYISDGNSNYSSREKMKKILLQAIEDELTEKQRKCLTDYYLLKKKEKEIAFELGLNPSTVSRHISMARKKLKHIATYYM